jgi:hypothetical protein
VNKVSEIALIKSSREDEEALEADKTVFESCEHGKQREIGSSFEAYFNALLVLGFCFVYEFDVSGCSRKKLAMREKAKSVLKCSQTISKISAI